MPMVSGCFVRRRWWGLWIIGMDILIIALYSLENGFNAAGIWKCPLTARCGRRSSHSLAKTPMMRYGWSGWLGTTIAKYRLRVAV